MWTWVTKERIKNKTPSALVLTCLLASRLCVWSIHLSTWSCLHCKSDCVTFPAWNLPRLLTALGREDQTSFTWHLRTFTILPDLSFQPIPFTSLSSAIPADSSSLEQTNPVLKCLCLCPGCSIYLKCPSSSLWLENSYSSFETQLAGALLWETLSELSRYIPCWV